MAKSKNNDYTNESISKLKGADRVRLRPAVIFGSDGLDGCEHAVFEILSNSIDEAREGYGNLIEVKKYLDNSIEVTDYGRGIPVDYNPKEGMFNWELVFCELYAGGKYKTNSGENYEYSLGTNGLGACATQYSSEYMDVTVYRDGYKYDLHFEKGVNIGGLKKEEYNYKHTRTQIRWRPDLEVFTDINIPEEYFHDIMKKQAIVNKGLKLVFKCEKEPRKFEETEYIYNNGIVDYVNEIAAGEAFTAAQTEEHQGCTLRLLTDLIDDGQPDARAAHRVFRLEKLLLDLFQVVGCNARLPQQLIDENAHLAGMVAPLVALAQRKQFAVPGDSDRADIRAGLDAKNQCHIFPFRFQSVTLGGNMPAAS